MDVTRRKFLQVSAATAATVAVLNDKAFALKSLQPVVGVENPLESYPERDWERVYLDQYRYDSTFTYVCSPNDTHACRVRAFVRNGIIARVEQNYDVSRYGDLYGNKASAAWHPRMCLKGYTLHRRLYGPYRLKGPMMRKGWKQWADDGFPELTPATRSQYKFDARGQDEWLRLSWDEAFTYIAKGFTAVARRYSGEEGAKKLREQGYPPEMIDAMHGAGTRTFKFRGGMGLLGVMGKYGMYRLGNTMAILDSIVRGVEHEKALGTRTWSNYTWHGDQAPGHPWVHGLQASDTDFNDLRFSKLHIQIGKNLVENKMPESHFFIEGIERGAKVVVIVPEYSPPVTKADYWLPIRPQTDAALLLGITRILMDRKLYDLPFVKQFTDFPLLVRTDNLKRLRAHEVFPGYQLALTPEGASFKIQGLTQEQYRKLGDYVVWDAKSNSPKPLTRDDVGDKMAAKGIDPALEWKGQVKLADGKEVEAMTLWEMYKIHLRDYDLDSVVEITGSPRELIERLALDIADPKNKPVCIHVGEGMNHWFHATESNRATYLPLMLTGNIGIIGSGSHTWAGNYKAANFQGSALTGPGFKGWVAEDPFEPNLDPNTHGKEIHAHAYTKDEEPAFWDHGVDRQDTPLKGDYPLIVHTPKYGRKVFTGNTHMPSPTKVMFYTNVNIINNAKWAYGVIRNVNPLVEMIISTDIEMTASIEYSDIALAANAWPEFQTLEVTSSCSNPFLQIWKGGVKPIYDNKDDTLILAGVAEALAKLHNDQRFSDYWKFALEGRPEVYIQRLLDASNTTSGYKVEEIMAGKYGEPGAALLLYRTYPRQPFWEQVHDSLPFFTDTGRMHAYSDIPEAIEYGENFIVHREGTEATPYLPNVIVSSNPYVRPDDYGIPPTATDWDERTVRNIKMGWSEAKRTKNFLWEKGYRFYLLTPKTRHRVHSQWSVCDWNLIWDSNFGDPYRMDKRTPGVGEHQLHINPREARRLGINDGDYIYVDANPMDRPYIGWKPSDPFYKVARCMVRAKYNPAYPDGIVMMKHAPFIATEQSVKAHETRPDGRALSATTGYQANLRYGSQQSCTRDWSMPMHQTDTLFHKAKVNMSFIFGGEADNHAVNTVPKETLVKITKAEDGGLGGKGIWDPAKTGFTPGNESEAMKKYLKGGFVKVES